MVTNPAVLEEVAAQASRAFGERRPDAVRAEPDDTLLAAWTEAEPKLRRLAAAMGVGRGQIDDVLQDVFIAARQSSPVEDEEGCRRWLFRVAINRCRLEHRRRKRWQAAWERLRDAWAEHVAGGESDAAAGREEQLALRRALRQLPPQLRNLKVKRTLLKVELAGVKARLSAIEAKISDIKDRRAGGTIDRLVDLKVSADIDLASLAAQRKVLDELVDGQRRLAEIAHLRFERQPFASRIETADEGLPRCDEILADLKPFQLVDDTVVIRPLRFHAK